MTLDETKGDKELKKHMDLICEAYPDCKRIRDTFREFHDIIIVAPKIEDRTAEKREEGVENLKKFIAKHREDELMGFAKSLDEDLPYVTNAIMMDESSGGVEGRNNKVKVYEKLHFGRASRETLEPHLQFAFMYTAENFSMYELVPELMEELKSA